MSDLPETWCTATVADVSKLVRGVTFKKAEASTESQPDTVPVIRAGNIQNERLVLDRDLIYVPAARVKAEQRLRAGDIVIASSSGSLSVVGKSARLILPWEGAHGGFLTVVRPLEGVNGSYLAHWLQSPAVRRLWSGLAAGTSINNLKIGHFHETTVPFPPLAEQERIVAAIEEHLSHLDAAMRSLARVQRNIDRLVLSAIEACTAGSWSDVRLEEVAEPGQITDGPFGSNLKSSHYTETGPRVVRLENIGRGEFIPEMTHISVEHYEALRKHNVQPGDLLVASLYSDRLRSCLAPEDLGPAIVKADCIRIRLGDQVDSRFVAYSLRRPVIDRWCETRTQGVGRQRLGLGNIRDLPVPLPPRHVQERIADQLDEIDGTVRRRHDEVAGVISRGVALRRSVLDAAFSGQLVPQDATDEPASGLLERLRDVATAKKPSRRKKHT